MVSTPTPVCDFGARAIDFNLPGVDGKNHSLASATGPNGLLELQYRGRLDALHGKHTVDKSTRRELFEAMKQVALQDCGPREQFPSIGCSIKWREEK